MSTIIKFDLKELKKLANDKNSCVVEKKVTQNLALQPWCLGNLKESIKNLLDYKIGKFDKEYNGILLSYKNLRVLQNIGAIRNDNSAINFQVQADYFIFRPYVGATLKGVVNKKSNTHLGILLHRVFNVVIPRPTEEPGNEWIGTTVSEGQEVMFEIMVLDLYGALPYIRGKLDERWLNNDDNDEYIETNLSKPINVTYVNFDKTKPNQKQMGDGPQHSKNSTNLLAKNGTMDSQLTQHSQNDSLQEKPKSKRLSKTLDSETKQSDGNLKPSKKHRRDM